MEENEEEMLGGIILGDAYELIKQLPDKSIDLIVTDPPYEIDYSAVGIKSESTQRFSERMNDKKETLLKGIDIGILGEFVRVLKMVNMYIFCSKKQLPKYLNFAIDNGYNWDILIYHKLNCLPLCADGYVKDKEFCVLIREKGAYMSRIYENKKTVWSYSIPLPESQLWDHPTIKPLQMVEGIIGNSTREGDVVLDPFMGSGTTAVACKEIGRIPIGFEIDPHFYEVCQERLRGVTKRDKIGKYEQLKLDVFGEEEKK